MSRVDINSQPMLKMFWFSQINHMLSSIFLHKFKTLVEILPVQVYTLSYLKAKLTL